jgi:hypothetical protein
MVARTHVNFTLYVHCHLIYCKWIDLLSHKLTSTPVNISVYAYRSADTPEHRDWKIIQAYSLINPRLKSSRPTSTRAHIFGPQANRTNSKVRCWSSLWISELASSGVTARRSCWFSSSKASLNKLRNLMNLSLNLRREPSWLHYTEELRFIEAGISVFANIDSNKQRVPETRRITTRKFAWY